MTSLTTISTEAIFSDFIFLIAFQQFQSMVFQKYHFVIAGSPCYWKMLKFCLDIPGNSFHEKNNMNNYRIL